MQDRIWLSHDISSPRVRDRFYRWLAAQDARECGPALVTLNYVYRDELLDELIEEMAKEVDPSADDRIYLIFKDPFDGEVTGAFIFGQRKSDIYPTSPEYHHSITRLN